MLRKKAVVAAAAIAGTMLAASSAYALTSGVVGSATHDGAGELSPIVEVPATADSPTTESQSGRVSVTNDREEDSWSEDDPDHDEREDEVEREYEGRDDDD